MSTIGDFTKELFNTIRKLEAVDQRSADILNAQVRLELKIDKYIERLAKLETLFEMLQSNMNSEKGYVNKNLLNNHALMQLLEIALKESSIVPELQKSLKPPE